MPTFREYVDKGLSILNDNINKKIFYFNNVADMKAAAYLKSGDMAITKGYYTPGDGGSGEYEIISSDTELTDDGGSIHKLSNGLYAKLIINNGEINVKQFGAVGDGTTDDTTAIQNALDMKLKTIFPVDNVYVAGGLKLYKGQIIDGLCTFIYSYGHEFKKSIIKAKEGCEYVISDCRGACIRNIHICGNGKASSGIFMGEQESDSYGQLDGNVEVYNCRIYKCKYGIYFPRNGSAIQKNNIDSNDIGIYKGFDSSIINNVIVSNRIGIHGYNSNDMQISNNKIEWNTEEGIFFESGLNNLITSNTIDRNGIGIKIKSFLSGTISSNVIRRNLNYNIYIYGCKYTSITSNALLAMNSVDGEDPDTDRVPEYHVYLSGSCDMNITDNTYNANKLLEFVETEWDKNTIISNNSGSGTSDDYFDEFYKKKPFYYDNISDVKSSTYLKVGDFIISKGYYESNDDGGGEYEIVSDSLTDDGGSVIALSNGLFAKLVYGDSVNSKQFGITSSNSSNFKNFLKFGSDNNIKLILEDDITYENADSEDTIYQLTAASKKTITHTGKGVLFKKNSLIENIDFVFNSSDSYMKLTGDNAEINNCDFKRVLTVEDGTEWKKGGTGIYSNVSINNISLLNVRLYNFESALTFSGTSDAYSKNLTLENVEIYNSRIGMYLKYCEDVKITNYTFKNTKEQQETYRNITEKVSWTNWHHAGKDGLLDEYVTNMTIRNYTCEYPEERAIYNSAFNNLKIYNLVAHNGCDFEKASCVCKFDGKNALLDGFTFTFDDDKGKTYPWYASTSTETPSDYDCSYGAFNFRHARYCEIKNGKIDYSNCTYSGIVISAGSQYLKIHDIEQNNVLQKPIFIYYDYNENRESNEIRNVELYNLVYNNTMYTGGKGALINVNDDYHTSDDITDILLKNISFHDNVVYGADNATLDSYSKTYVSNGYTSIIYARYLDGFTAYNNQLHGMVYNSTSSKLSPYGFNKSQNIQIQQDLYIPHELSDYKFMGDYSYVSNGSKINVIINNTTGIKKMSVYPRLHGYNNTCMNKNFVMEYEASFLGELRGNTIKLFSCLSNVITATSLGGYIEVYNDNGDYGKFILIPGGSLKMLAISDSDKFQTIYDETYDKYTVSKASDGVLIETLSTNTDNLYVKARFELSTDAGF